MYSTEILQTIKDHTDDDNCFTYDQQVQFTQELMEEFFYKVTLEEARIIYNKTKEM